MRFGNLVVISVISFQNVMLPSYGEGVRESLIIDGVNSRSEVGGGRANEEERSGNVKRCEFGVEGIWLEVLRN